MAVITTKELLQAGFHFGSPKHRWHPNMKPYVLGERNGIYIIDLRKTAQAIEQAYSFVRDLIKEGKVIMFVGTKKQAQQAIVKYATSCAMPYVNERWLGGMLTNFATVSSRIRKLVEYEAAKSAGEFEGMPKKEALSLLRKMAKLQRNLGGIRNLTKPPDALFVIDIGKEHLAVTEANKLAIPVVALVDSDCNPDLVTYPIPGNDDAIRSAEVICRVISEAVKEGQYIQARTVLSPASEASGTSVSERSFGQGSAAVTN